MTDISNGITLTDEERLGPRKAVADMNERYTEAEKRLAVLTALHVLHAGLPALALTGPEGAIMAGALELVMRKMEQVEP